LNRRAAISDYRHGGPADIARTDTADALNLHAAASP
jgi:hypothetical protein